MEYKIALVHDYLSQDGGAERVLRVFHEIWPDAPIFVQFFDREKTHLGFDDCDVRSSFIEKLPFWKNHYQWYLPLMPKAVESYDLLEFDVVLSSTSAYAKGILTREDAAHICYCHTPTRYLWSESENYIKNLKYPSPIKALLPPLFDWLRQWDATVARARVDQFIANSKTVSSRIEQYYGKESVVIHPPLELSCPVTTSIPDEPYFLAGGRLVPYKRFDLIIDVFNRLGWKLKIFGSGREEIKLKAMAGPTIEFLGHVADEEKCGLYAGAQAYIHPQEEDFGITVIESQMMGTPVIAYQRGGATESVIDGVTGVFFAQQEWSDLLNAVLRFDADQFDPTAITAHAQQFNKELFKQHIKAVVEKTLAKKRKQYARTD